MSDIHATIRRLAAIILLLSCASVSADTAEMPPAALTSLRQLRLAVDQRPRMVCSFQIEAVVRAADKTDHTLFLQDDSEADLIQADWDNAAFQPGQRVLLRGTNCAVGWNHSGLRIDRMPVVDVDGSHPPVTNTGMVFLHAGQNFIKVDWFNDVLSATLEVDYKGPGVSHKKIPDSALFQAQVAPSTGRTNFVNGLDYRCFEGEWNRLPDFDELTPTKTGTAKNFDINVRSRSEHAGVEFTGFLKVPVDGFYTFYVKSDDGGKLFLPEILPQLTVAGSASLKPPRRILIGEVLSPDEESQWSEVEGELSSVGERPGGTELELSAGDNRMRLNLANDRGEPPVYLLHSRVRVTGICQGTYSDGGNLLANTMVLPDWSSIRVLDVAPEFWSEFQNINPGDLTGTNFAGLTTPVCVQGKIRTLGPERLPVLQDGTGQVQVELLMPPPDVENEPVQVLGEPAVSGTNIILRQAIYRKQSANGSEGPDVKTVLTTAAQVQRLSREQAQRGYHVKIRGVVTYVAPNFASLVIQDSTRAIFVTHYSGGWEHGVPRVGDLWEIQGISNPADFSPVVELQQATRLGPGRLPDPVRPTWDQLINGSLDAQYVELEGIVTAVNTNRVALLTRIGKIDVVLMGFPPKNLLPLENALVSIRGCLFAEWDRESHRVKIKSGIEIGNPSVTVDVPAPANPFDAVRKSAAELLYFDPQASAFQRVKISGQILHSRENMYYMTDGTNGVRFLPKENVSLQPGDLVEVVGYPQLGGPSPVLREAVARKTGHAPLPPPRRLPADNLIQDDCDSTLVRVEGLLVNVRDGQTEQTLEMQSGLRTFVARLNPPDAGINSLETGSRLELTGVYVGLGGNRAEGRDINSFELLLNSPADIRVLARPPWWTLKRLFILIGLLVGGLALATVWINLLRRQVERRTNQLKREIHDREQAEQRHAIETERTRIARDIHDELGASLSQIRLLSELTLSHQQTPPEIRSHTGKISAKALETTRTLDEIVWAVDPHNDTLESLLNYMFSFASDYLSLAGIRFRIDAPTRIPAHVLTTQVRHQLYMAIKEALTNIVNHAHATEVWIRVLLNNGAVTFVIEDNGRGFEIAEAAKQNPNASGLNNLRERFREIDGSFTVDSAPNRGTSVKFTLPLKTTLTP